jgi:hypothetical protein
MLNSVISKSAIIISVALLASACDRAGDTPAKPASRWQLAVDSEPGGESKTVHMMVAALNQLESQKGRAVLVLSCEGGATDVYVIWHQYLGTYDLDVTWRVGSDPDVTENWSLSTDNEAIFAPEPVELINRMMTHDLFLIKTSPFGSSPVTLQFNTAGLEKEVTPLREACSW